MKLFKTLIGSGLVGLMSILAIGPKVRAAMPNGILRGAGDEPEFKSRFSTVPQATGLMLDQRVLTAIDRARAQYGLQQMQEGVFVFSPEGELQLMSHRSEIQNTKEELIRMRLKNLYAGNTVPTTEM
jgi:hypothetical protein